MSIWGAVVANDVSVRFSKLRRFSFPQLLQHLCLYLEKSISTLCTSRKKYVVQGRCSLCTWPEFHSLASENATTLGEWMFQDLICCWGGLYEIVTNNGGSFIKGLAYPSKNYHINHIHISRYNSHANGIIEESHFDVQQALVMASNG